MPVLSLAQACAEDDTFSVRMHGYAEGVGFAAREKAIENAKSEVVTAVLQSLVASGDLQPLRPILRNAGSYVVSYDLLRHDVEEGATTVEIDAHVLEKPLHRDVATVMLPRLPRPPTILLVVGERIGDDRIAAVHDYGAAEATLIEAMEKLGLSVSGSASVEAHYNHSQLVEIVNGGVEPAQRFARGSLADVVVIGQAVTEVQGDPAGGSLIRNRATVNLRIFRGADGKMTDAFTAVAAVLSQDPLEGGEQAIRDAGAKLVGDITVATVLTVLGAQASDNVLIEIENPGSRERIAAVVAFLEAGANVASVEQLLWSESFARLQAVYPGPMSLLADSLESGTYEGARLQIRRVVGRRMELRFP